MITCLVPTLSLWENNWQKFSHKSVPQYCTFTDFLYQVAVWNTFEHGWRCGFSDTSPDSDTSNECTLYVSNRHTHDSVAFWDNRVEKHLLCGVLGQPSSVLR
jgi:hypothetical protein